MLDPWLELPFHPPHKEWFRQGGWRLWTEQYPMLLDEDDRRKAIKQAPAGQYFCEWLSAVTLFNRHHLLSLIDQYSSPNHRYKTETIERIAPTAVLRVIRDKERFGGTRPPDLFVYSEDGAEWFFAEVKGPMDKLRPNQVQMIAALEDVTGEPVRMIRLRNRARADRRFR